MKKSVLFTAAAMLAVASCNGSKTTLISGTAAEGCENLRIFSGLTEEEIAQVPVKDGKFSCEIPTNVKDLYIITDEDISHSFIADGSKLTVDMTSEGGDVQSSKNSVHQKMLDENQWYADFMKSYTPEKDAELTKEYVDHCMEALSDNSDNTVGLLTLVNLQGQVEDDVLADAIEKLDPAFDSYEFVQQLKSAVNKRKGTSAGEMFTDFEVEQPDGKTVKLSDYVGKGKYILVDFWASWCGPCKREIPNIKAAWEKYHGEKFDVLSVAVWDKPEDTAKAAKEHGVVWSQIVNAQRIPTDIYGIEGIPHLILFGPDGTIVKRGEGLRGEGLEKTLSELL